MVFYWFWNWGVGTRRLVGTQQMNRTQINEYLESIDENTLLMDGFDEAIIGFSQRIGEPLLAVYSWEKMVAILVERDKMQFDDAVEYIDFNCIGAWVGEQTPIIVMPIQEI